MSALLPLGQRVSIATAGDGAPLVQGTIVGYGTMQRREQGTDRLVPHASLTYLVELDKGFHAEDKSTFVSVLSVHPDSIVDETWVRR